MNGANRADVFPLAHLTPLPRNSFATVPVILLAERISRGSSTSLILGWTPATPPCEPPRRQSPGLPEPLGSSVLEQFFEHPFEFELTGCVVRLAGLRAGANCTGCLGHSGYTEVASILRKIGPPKYRIRFRSVIMGIGCSIWILLLSSVFSFDC